MSPPLGGSGLPNNFASDTNLTPSPPPVKLYTIKDVIIYQNERGEAAKNQAQKLMPSWADEPAEDGLNRDRRPPAQIYLIPMPTRKPSNQVMLERALSFANEAMWTVALQRRRVRSSEPEDEKFVFRQWVDLQFLITALWRLRRAAELACKVPPGGMVAEALRAFDDVLPHLRTMRNVGEHANDYVTGDGRHRSVSRHMLQVGTWDGTIYTWLGSSLDVDAAHDAAVKLFASIRSLSKLPTQRR
jgi:hypothetical protein